ncbi:MAG: superoxide dismutase [Armatimonadetes bacterium]|nr:superoxide dismutase [Armatimonadota bacterium]
MDSISRNQIEQHYTLYENYVKKTNEIHSKLRDVDRESVNQNYSELRELKVELSFTLDAVKLHEAYFFNLGGKGSRPNSKVADLINKSFGSQDAWESDLRASGMAARGWVITAFDFDDNRLHNYIADDHNTYGIWNALPVIVLDSYEHAYMIDYGIKRPPYIDAFLRNLNWDEINKRVDGITFGAEPRPSM